ncbi:hypothetical protein ES703_68957 [subsurface metagenome]
MKTIYPVTASRPKKSSIIKRIILLALAVFIPLACTGMPPAGAPEAQREIDALMERWITSLKDENTDVFMSAYWPEAEKVIVQPDGKERHLRGLDEIRAQQMKAFESSDIFRELHYSEPEREFRGNTATYIYHVEGPGVHFSSRFELVRI